METFDTILDWMIMHQVRLMQLSITYQAQAQAPIDATEEELGKAAEAVAAYLMSVGGLRLDDTVGQGVIQTQLNQGLQARKQGYDNSWTRLTGNLDELMDYERQFYTAILRNAGIDIADVSPVRTEPRVMGSTMPEWNQRLIGNDAQRLRDGVYLGTRLGDDQAALRARLLGRKQFRGVDGIVETSRRELDTLVRTATDAFADLARVQIDLGSAYAGREMYVAILDGRTTKMCQDRHGHVYKVGEGPRPPMHWNCRSIRVPLVGDGTPVIPSYKDWLAQLEARDQDEVLGPRQGEQFRSGRLDLSRFQEPAWGGISIKTMAERERPIFEQAGMITPTFR